MTEEPIPRVVVPDDARRAADIINMHIMLKKSGWVAIRLSDGGSDGVVYDQRADAVRHQLHENQCAYFQLPLIPVTPWECDVFLRYNRQLYDNGMRMGDPDAPTPIVPIRTENIPWRPPTRQQYPTMSRSLRRKLKGF
jgi:hypothetical protein